MTKPLSTARWYTPWRQSGGAAAQEEDAADWGTAFGLEMSMSSVLPGASDDLRGEQQNAPVGWFSRLTGGRFSSAR